MKPSSSGNVQHLIGVDVDVAGTRQAQPLLQEVAATIEDLYAVVLAVGHEHPPVVCTQTPWGTWNSPGPVLPGCPQDSMS